MFQYVADYALRTDSRIHIFLPLRRFRPDQMRIILALFLVVQAFGVFAQNGVLRGNVFDRETGEPIIYGTVILRGTTIGTNTDLDGFFSFSDLEPGEYTVEATYIGYDTTRVSVNVVANGVAYEKLFLSETAIQLETVQVSGRRSEQRTQAYVSKITVTKAEIEAMPSTGSEPDIAQSTGSPRCDFYR